MKGAKYHVSPCGKDTNTGGAKDPLKTIQQAADRAQAGDTIIVHEGIYRERINPPRGGTSDANRIVFKAAKDERVQIKGSEQVQNWTWVENDIWSVEIPNQFFGDFNPYQKKIKGHWFIDNGRDHHPGAVYLNNHWLIEAATLEDLRIHSKDEAQWFASVDSENTIIWAEFRGIDPNENEVEIAVRQSVFYPSESGISYLTVSGFELYHAATPWAPPTTEQIGLIGTNWGKGWIIENNRIAYSTCSGITLGKYDDPDDFGNFDLVEFTNEDTYHGTIKRALKHGWSLESTGNHIIRNNHVSHCEMAGICGSLGAVKSVIENNVVHDIHVHRQFTGHEQAGIKFHAPIDCLIRKNTIYNCPKGLWMDWMTQGTRITQNICFDNGPDMDLYTEVNHGPTVIDNNLFLSKWSVHNCSEGSLFAHNYFAGKFSSQSILNRTTPIHKEHSTEIVDFAEIQGGDDHVLFNVFSNKENLKDYGKEAKHPIKLKNNLVCNENSSPEVKGENSSTKKTCNIQIKKDKLSINYPKFTTNGVEFQLLNATHSLGKTCVSKLRFKNYDGTQLSIDTDFSGTRRNPQLSTYGPFESKIDKIEIPIGKSHV